MEIHTIKFEIYPRKIWIAQPESYDELNRRFQFIDGGAISYSPELSVAECFGSVRDIKTTHLGVIMITDNLLEISTRIIVHESCHLSSLYLKDLGDEDSNGLVEHYCYLTEYIFDKIEKIKEKKVKEVSKAS